MLERNETILLLIGLVLLTVAVVFGWILIAGFVPAHSPTLSAVEIAQIYRDNNLSIRAGLVLAIWGGPFMLLVIVLVSMLMVKAAGKITFYAITQALAGLLAAVLFIFPFFFWIVAAFRPDRPPSEIQLLNDLGWITLMTPFAPFVLQLLAICMQGLSANNKETYFMPRWACYMGMWVAIGGVPSALIAFADQGGHFAWNGMIGFWLPAIAIVVWIGALVAWGMKEYSELLPLRFERNSKKIIGRTV